MGRLARGVGERVGREGQAGRSGDRERGEEDGGIKGELWRRAYSPLAPRSTKPKPSLSFFCRSTVFSLMM